jgi:hypothetical protein
MQAITDFLSQGWVLGLMGVLLLALIGLMVYLRMKPRDEE